MSIPKTEKNKILPINRGKSNFQFDFPHIMMMSRHFFSQKNTYNACFTKNEKKEKHTHKSCFQRENGTIWNNWNKIEHVSFAACGDRRKKNPKNPKKNVYSVAHPYFHLF